MAEALPKFPSILLRTVDNSTARCTIYVQGCDTSVYFGASGLTFALSRREGACRRHAHGGLRGLRWFGLPPEPANEVRRWAVKLDF